MDEGIEATSGKEVVSDKVVGGKNVSFGEEPASSKKGGAGGEKSGACGKTSGAGSKKEPDKAGTPHFSVRLEYPPIDYNEVT